jgi:hypothetical protein
MIGTKFAKPLQPDTLTRTLTRTETREEKHMVGYPVEREITRIEQEPIHKTITTDDGEKVQVISGYMDTEVTETVQDIEYREETRTITVEVPEQEEYPNPAPNTYTKYREAAQWCNKNGAMMVDCQPTAEYPNGYYEVQVIPEPSIEELREVKLVVLNAVFEGVCGSAWVMSSLGFKADANTTANTNVDGLIKSMTARNEATTLFCDYDNVYRLVTLENLQTLQLEIIQNGQALYAQKWAMRDAINSAGTTDEIEAVNIVFTMMDFTI